MGINMRELQQFFISINNMSLENNLYNVCVSLKDKEGKIIKKIKENALLPDKNFRDLSGLYIGLKEAENFGVRRILILTDNSFLGTIINNGLREDYMDYYGFYDDISNMIDNFEEVRVKVVD